MPKCLIAFYVKKESLQISWKNLQTRTQSAERIAFEITAYRRDVL